MATANDLLTRVRILIDDQAGDKSVFKENLARSIQGNQVGSGNLSFQLNNRRLIATSLSVLADGSAATVSSSADQALRGRFTITSSAPSSSCFATYDFQFFTDTELTDFVNQAADFVEGVSDVTTVQVGLLDALVLKAASDACFALASRSGSLYNAAAGGKSAQKGDISRKYKDLAKDLFDRAVAEREAFYGPRKGQASSPASGKFATKQTPWTPRR